MKVRAHNDASKTAEFDFLGGEIWVGHFGDEEPEFVVPIVDVLLDSFRCQVADGDDEEVRAMFRETAKALRSAAVVAEELSKEIDRRYADDSPKGR